MIRTIICILAFFIVMPPADVMGGNENKIALVMKALSNPFFLKMKSGAEEYAVKNNIHLDVFGVERETEIDRQISIVDNLISRDYQAVIIAPADSKKLIPVCKKAIKKGITVINIDNPFNQEMLKANSIKIPFIGSDNHRGASMAAEYIKRKMNGRGRAVIIEGIRGVENAELRKNGFIDTLTKNSQIEILAAETGNWHTDEAFSVMASLLLKHKTVDAVLCANDKMALGAIQALDMSGIAGGVWVGGYDNIDEARNEMRNKRMHATIEQHPELMGQYGVEFTVRALAGEPVPDYIPTPLDLITFDGFDKKIGLSLSYLGNPFFTRLLEGAREAAALFGMHLTVSDAHKDDAEQLVSVQQFVSEKTDLIIINPTDTHSISPAVEIAEAAGIKVITVDRKASANTNIISHVASDNIAGGRLAGEFVSGKLNGSGKVLEIEGIPGTSAAHERSRGFNEVIRRYPDVIISERTVADFAREKARLLVGQLLKTGSVFDAVFAHNDLMILGGIDAYKAAGIPFPRVMVGFDAIPEALHAVDEGILTATVAQKPGMMGRIAVQSAAKVFRGETIEKEILVELKLITKN